MVKVKHVLQVVLSILFVAGCGGELSVQVVNTPTGGTNDTVNVPATVEAAVAATFVAETQKPVGSATPQGAGAATTEPPPEAAAVTVPTAGSAPNPTLSPRVTAIPASTPQADRMAPGTILFVQESAILSGTKTVQVYSLHSITDGEAGLMASDLDKSCDLSPDGTMVSSYGFGFDAGPLQIIQLDASGGSATVSSYPIPDQYPGDYQRNLISDYWSPDSTRLALKTDCSLYVVTLATGKFVEIWRECHAEVVLHKGIIDVVWGPDGTQIAFTVVTPSGFPSSNLEDDLHGGHPTKLLVASADGATDVVIDEHGSLPVWSPDGRQLLYAGGWRRDNDGDVYCNEKLYVAMADGSGRVQLAETTGGTGDSWTDPYYDYLGWSADGQRVYFMQGKPTQPGQLSTMYADGTGRVNLSGDNAFRVNYWPESGRITWSERSEEANTQPTWMRGHVAYASDLDGTDKIEWDQGQELSQLWSCGNNAVWQSDSTWYVAGLGRSDKRQLSVGQSGSSLRPFFSPDCSQVVIAPYSVLLTGLDQLAVVDLASGAEVQSLVAGSGEKFHVLGWVQTEW